MAGDTDLTMLMRLAEQGLAETRAMRAELREHRSLLLGLTEAVRRLDRRDDQIERRLVELKDDLELMIRSELMGRAAHMETQAEAREAATLSEVLRQVEDLIAQRTTPLAERIAVLEKH